MKYQKLSCAVTSMVLAIVLMVLSVCAPIGALETVSTSNEDKIDSALKEKMATASPDEKIPVAIWYADVDQDNIDKLTAEKVGFTQDDVAVAYEMPSTELLASLEAEEAGATDEMQSYLKRTERQREQERKRTDEYIMTRREFSREKYNAKSADIIKDIKINDEDITFKSQYAPMIIVNLLLTEIERLTSVSAVECMSYSPELTTENCNILMTSSSEPNVDYETQMDITKKTINHNKLTNILGIDGTGVNVGVIETGGQTIEDSELTDVDINYVGEVYYDSDHITEVSKRISGSTSGFAEGATLYCTHPSYSNMESLLSVVDDNNEGIKVINMSYAVAYVDGTIAYMTFDRWVNHIVAQHGITVVVAANNKGATTGAISSPALAHNVITVGAYHPGPDYLTFTYDTTDDRMAQSSSYNNGTCISKPDVVMPGGSTSYATPMLTGSIALMIKLKPLLAMYPQAIKAIVLASCHRKVLSYTGEIEELIEQGITDKQGAGAPDVWTMASIVCNGTYGVGRIIGTKTQAVRRFVMPNSGASNINISLTWLKEDVYDEGVSHYVSEDVGIDELDVDLDLFVYRNGTLLDSMNITNSYTEMAYHALNSSEIDYEIRINKVTTSYTNTVRYGYAYSVDETYVQPITDEGIYYIRNYYTDKYLTLDTTTGETTMQDFATTAEGRQNQMWVLKGTQDDYELLPAYGSVGQKLNFGAQVGTNPYYKSVIGTSDLNLTLKSWEMDTSLEPDAYVFTSTSGGSNNIMSYTYSTGVFVRSETESVVNMYRMWVLEDINYLLGDVTMDCSVDDNDMTFIQRYTVGQETLNNTTYYLADFNIDGVVNIKDATAIQQYVDVLEEG